MNGHLSLINCYESCQNFFSCLYCKMMIRVSHEFSAIKVGLILFLALLKMLAKQIFCRLLADKSSRVFSLHIFFLFFSVFVPTLSSMLKTRSHSSQIYSETVGLVLLLYYILLLKSENTYYIFFSIFCSDALKVHL